MAVGELDPLNRRLGAQKKPDVVVQVVILAEDNMIRDKLAEHDLHVQTIADVAPIEVQPARVLSHLYTYLGRNKKLGLSGRKSRDVGILSTSKLYSLKDRIFAFTPQVSQRILFFRCQFSFKTIVLLVFIYLISSIPYHTNNLLIQTFYSSSICRDSTLLRTMN